MAHAVDAIRPAVRSSTDSTSAVLSAYQAFRILQAGFVVAPIVAGADKFLNLLVDWE